jgi:quinol monooxygenase YgiN
MSLTIIGTMIAKPGSEATAHEALKSLIEPSSHEDGCLRYELFQSTADPSRFFTFEVWRDQSALDAHMHALYMVEAIKGASEHLVGGAFQTNPVKPIE